MASCVRNICAKNRQNPLILLKVTIDNVGILTVYLLRLSEVLSVAQYFLLLYW